MFPTEPNTSQIYKTHKILERARNIFNTSAVIYKWSPFALPYVCTDHTQPTKGQSYLQTGDLIAMLYLAWRFASPVLNLYSIVIPSSLAISGLMALLSGGKLASQLSLGGI